MDLLPLKEFLDTNYSPTDWERTQIQEYLEISAQQQSILNADVEAALQALEAAKQRRDDLSSRIEKYRYLLSPIRRLPPDVLITIFRHCLPEDHNGIMSLSEAPLVLPLVCRQWREVALNDPFLWSTLHIPIPDFPRLQTRRGAPSCAITDALKQIWAKRMEERNRAVEGWLSRAKSLKLSISISVDRLESGYFYEACSQEPVKAQVSLLQRYSPQWKNLQISAPTNLLALFMDTPAMQTRGLRSLELDFCRSKPRSKITSFTPGSLITSKALTSIRIASVWVPPRTFLQIPISWSNITELSFLSSRNEMCSEASLDTRSALKLLSRCPNLRTCVMTISGTSRTASQPEPSGPIHVTLPRLESLVWIQKRGAPFPPLSDLDLDLPALHTLSVFNAYDVRAIGRSPVPGLVKRYSQTIKTLSFQHRYISTTELREVLKLAKNVKTLDIGPSPPHFGSRMVCADGYWDSSDDHYEEDSDSALRPQTAHFDASVLAAMAATSSDRLCPNLSTLCVRLGSRKEFNQDDLVAFIRSRRLRGGMGEGGPRLTCVKVLFPAIRNLNSESSRQDVQGSLLDTLREGPDVDLGGLRVEVQWARRDDNLKYAEIEKRTWDPCMGL
ncbi:hypothetical protein CC1G_02626 [Coprinopsis cinerea okayama7|uniref:F-box domain-containing protein n=1 Tax=Coprinopsis cinerea (strain Okayama-7 / 130 / ATCC MYA-4618 / FGSC 9003) TaxID=240176 RepID=A8PBE4_COPC7|nr:hypothetical protein CC1G_02626 [Coprinopsis cinerea okayama7\|eukprot:XP_001840163.1 hypothetical protein CC1G_02626 [Coprinopsis cinerea okayama7\